MDFELWAFGDSQVLILPARAAGYGLVALYLLYLGWHLTTTRGRFWRGWSISRWAGLILAIIASFLASGVARVSWPGPEVVPLPNLPEVTEASRGPLLGAVAVMLAGGSMGSAPVVLVGVAAGLGHALWQSGRSTQVLELAVLSAGVGFLLQQRYRGGGFRWLRRPAVVGVVGGLAASLLAFPFVLTSTGPETPILSSVDYAWLVTRAAILPNLIEWGIAGLVLELIWILKPAWRCEPKELYPPPYAYSLTRRFLYVLIPGFFLTIVILLVAVTRIATNSAIDLTLNQMSHDARVASDAIPDLNVISISLLTQFAQNRDLAQGPLEEKQELVDQLFTLDELLRSTAFFRQMIVFDRTGVAIEYYPDDSIPLTEQESSVAIRAATEGHPGMSRVWIAEYEVPILTHVVPIRNETGEPVGALLGRVDLQVALSATVESLQGTVGAGRGFIVDEQGNIIAHSNSARLMQPWSPMDGLVSTLDAKLEVDDIGQAYEGVGYNGTRQLVYHRTGPDHPWSIVVIVPYERVLSLATEVAGPLALFLGGGGIIFALVLSLLIRRLNQPLSALSRAAGAMAHRDLETPVLVSGEDEVGRLGMAFEQMRQVLRDRLSELQMLLGVSQGVAANLNLSQGLPPILEGALEATGADGVRIVAVLGEEQVSKSYSLGGLGAAMTPLDGTIGRILQREPILRVDNTSRTRIIPGLGQLADRIGAVLALPLNTPQRYHGVLWIAYREPHAFSDSEIGFMTTLAGQASVLLENVQLFEAAEGGRRRLAAIVASTSDAVIVTDQHNRILLLNPAAEADFGIAASQVVGQPVVDVFSDEGLVSLLLGDKKKVGTHEVTLPNSRVLFASASPITSDDGQIGGRVAVLRDITYLKELGEMKTEFVNTVSHDLRSPLTYMRGYVTMLPMIGELSGKQKEYVSKVLSGIDQMTQLVEDLLNLARIESDVDQLVQPVHIGELVKGVVRSYRTHAVSKGLALDVEVAEGLPTIMGDPTLLRQAVSNLIDNAIKYTPSGEIHVQTFTEDDHVVVKVQDTGPGISQADQVRLFESFYRVKRRDSLEIKGTGLGLAIVKSIVERRHGGRVWVESKLGAGSAFLMALPVELTSAPGG